MVGLMLFLMLVNIWCGKVVCLGLVMNKVRIILLKEVVKVNKVFEISFGVIIGKVMWKKVCSGLVFRFRLVCIRL